MDLTAPFFAVAAAIGFAMVFKVPKKHLPIVAMLAFFGFWVKQLCLWGGLGVELAVLFGAFCVGAVTDLLSFLSKKPLQMLKVPAGIPMIPGLLVFEAISGLIFFVSASQPDVNKLSLIFYLTYKSIFILAALALGLTASSVFIKKNFCRI